MTLDTVVHGDCLAVLRQLPSEIADLTFADPPFNLAKRYRSYDDQRSSEEYLGWCRRWLQELLRITKPTGSIVVHNIPRWLTHYAAFLNERADFRHWIAWEALGMPLGKTLMPRHYGILFYARDKRQQKFYEIRHPHRRCRKCGVLHRDYGGKKHGLHPFGPLVSDVWSDLHRVKHASRRDPHPCQLPETLLERLLLMTTDAGDVVVDPFAGTGTTLVAAKKLGRRYLGIEIDAGYVAVARERLSQTQATSRIGEVWVSQVRGALVTIRDCDWPYLQAYYAIPASAAAIEAAPIAFDQRLAPMIARPGPTLTETSATPAMRRRKTA
ncbi:site-specific DNA-methyltransferase [Chloracidobacterium thermophilum]|uniref:DNA-methyltransferase n=1 Tax=Chloracidobacterium thermophilum TaxID=458033 RepID=UPI001F523BF5|nr:site-specific DNA-methyltransferase [Chloracidobacterium thermophilum]